MKFFVRLAINAAALWCAVSLIPGAEFEGGFIELFGLAVIFGLVNAVIRPVVKLLTLPLNVMTLGLFALVVNGAMLLLVAQVSDSLNFDERFFASLVSATLAALVISVVSTVLSKLLPDGR